MNLDTNKMTIILKKSILAAVFLTGASMPASSYDGFLVDFAFRGVNYPGWTTIQDCRSDRQGEGCFAITSKCAQFKLYTTKRMGSDIKLAYNDGQKIVVHAMKGGHFPKERFGDVLCKLGR